MKKTININMDQCSKDLKIVNDELDETTSKLNKKLDACIDKNIEMKTKHRSQIEEIKSMKSKYGADFCERTLTLREARIEEL